MPENLTEALRRELLAIDQKIQDLTNRKRAIENLLHTYRSGRKPAAQGAVLPMPLVSPALSTLDMAERVLQKYGEMKADQIMEAIRTEFGIKPAHTLPQMLYMRARTKKRFYRSPAGKFGLVEGRKRSTGKKNAA